MAEVAAPSDEVNGKRDHPFGRHQSSYDKIVQRRYLTLGVGAGERRWAGETVLAPD